LIINYLSKNPNHPKYILGEGIKVSNRKKRSPYNISYLPPSNDIDTDYAFNRLKLIIGEIEAGNYPNKNLFNELSNVIDYLLLHNAINKSLAVKITNKYMSLLQKG